MTKTEIIERLKTENNDLRQENDLLHSLLKHKDMAQKEKATKIIQISEISPCECGLQDQRVKLN